MSTHWTREQIRDARRRAIKPLVEALGYRLRPRPDNNYEIIGLVGEVVIKDHYWVRLQDGAAGNAIDFLVHVEGMSFNKAMATIQNGLPTTS